LNKDITAEGSGNVGALNSGKVSKSKIIGVTVLLIDILKGLLPLYLLLFVLNFDYGAVMAGSSCIILGHNYPVWLGFKGGRGLATGTGIYLLLNFFVVVGWGIVWLVVFGIKRKVLISNTIASMLIPLYVFFINKIDTLVVSWNLSTFSIFYFTFFSVVTAIIIVSRHMEIFKKN
jgi:glycerol-3-phosphate acyltransferase PlsY